MIVSLKQSILYVKKSCSQVSVNDEFLKKEIHKCILNLKETGFKVCAVIEDDHSANANVVHNVPIIKKNLWFSDVSREYKTKILGETG